MQEKNTPATSFLIIFITIVFLLGISYIGPALTIEGLSLKKYNLFSDILTKEKKKPVPVSIITHDTIILKDSVIETHVQKEVNTAIVDFAKDTIGGLDHFIKSLVETKKTGKITRVAYFGDSMIEGDILTQDLRSNLQSAFGGKGVGFVPMTSITAGFRQTIHQSFSNDWDTYSLITNTKPENSLGISGYVFIPQFKKDSITGKLNTSWVNYNACSYLKNLDTFHTLKLYYGESNENNYVKYQLAGKEVTRTLSGKNAVNEIVLNDSVPMKNVVLNFFCETPLKIYGASFESNSGVFVDNYSFRGNSGLPLTKIPANILRSFNTHLKYDLIIIHYGLNVANSNVKDYSWYQAGMTRVVNHLKACFPQSSFLLISIGDKSYKTNMEYETDPAIPLLVAAQRRIAEQTGIAFWNLYENMGGFNSMVSWVDSTEPLANKDYAHLNFRGGKKVADMLFKHLMEEYDHYDKAGKIQ